MNRIDMSDIRTRLQNLSSNYEKPSTINGQKLYEQASSTTNQSVIRRALSNWRSLAESDVYCISKLFDIFENVCKSGNIGLMKTVTRTISEDAIPKVRNGMETNNLIKHRTSRFKTKIQTKVQNKIDDLENLVTGTHITDATKAISAAAAAKTVAQANDEKIQQSDEMKAQEECCNIMEEASLKVACCDRIIENYNALSKRFNVDRKIRENASLGVYDTVFELCKLIDTYDMPTKIKYNTSIESSIYGLDKNSVPYTRSEIVSACTEYFSLKGKDAIDCIREVLESAQMVDDDDKICVDYITEKEPYDELCKFATLINSIDESTYYFIMEKQWDKITKSISKSNKNEVKTLIDSIKALPDKTPESIKSIIRKIYSKSPDDIINGTPNLLSWIRVALVLSTVTTIGPLTAIIAFIVDQFIALGVKRKDADRMVKKFVSDCEATKKKIDKVSDPEEKKRLEEYHKGLIKQTDRLVEYRDSLYTDDENFDREPESYDDSNDLGDLGDDFDFDIDESYSFSKLNKDIEYVSNMLPKLESTILKNMKYFDYETSDMISEMLSSIPDIINRRSISEQYSDMIYEERKRHGIDKYQKIDNYNNAKYTLESTSPILYNYEDCYTTMKVFGAFKDLCEAVDILSNCNYTVLTELSFANSLKMAREKLKKGITKLSDTERAASKTIDMSAEKVQNNIERSLSSDNREMIIKGSLLPSASKCLKTALAAGATAVLINPVIAIIGVLGKIACSKKYKAKERQLILDEIEIELKMVDKYLKIVEDKNDMQATKHLLQTQRTLERERQRIKYKMNVDFKQHVPNTKESDYDNY